jgi:RNA polymerase sigma-70 factor (ECF subfamily)
MADWVAELADGLVSLDGDAARDRELESLLVESAPLAFRVAYGVLRQRQDAEDVAQDALLKAFRRWPQLRQRERFRSWIVRMTWRLAIDRQRSDRRRSGREAAHAVEVHNGPSAESNERAAALWTAIDALPEKLRMTVVLAGIEGYDTREVATLLGVPEGTVKSRLFLARRRLKEMLKW